MSDEEKKVETKPPKIQKVHMDIDDEIKSAYDTVLNEMTKRIPGIKPSGPDVLRFALHIASESIDKSWLEPGSAIKVGGTL